MRRIVSSFILLTLAAFMAGCGSEPPHPGNLTVESDPPGAAITIDGAVTPYVTPHTFEGVEGGTTYLVEVAIAGWTSFPGERAVNVPFGSDAKATFSLSQGVGSLAVSSTPSGAAIFLDGADTGEVTPFTFDALIPGTYIVTVSLAGHVSQPVEIPITVATGGAESADFVLTEEDIPRIVLLEGFSNVYCVGCPTMNENVNFVLHQEGYGPDRVLFVKWPAFLVPFDPFYSLTETITNNRVEWYFGSNRISLPTLVGDGELLGGFSTPVNAQGILQFVDDQPTTSELSVTVTTDEDLDDIGDLIHDATVVLESPGGVDLSGYELNVVLVYEVVETENEGYIDGITEYHWVMRDHVRPSLDLGSLDAGTAVPFDVTLTDPLGGEADGHAVYPQNKQIIAWVQHGISREVIQAGSTVAP